MSKMLRNFVLSVVLLIGSMSLTGNSEVHAATSGNDFGEQIQHWGSYDGDGSSNFDTMTRPEIVSIPDAAPVIQVASSNSTEYALLGNGAVWAWGVGIKGQLGNGTHENSLNTPVQVSFPPGVHIQFLATDVMPANSALAVDTRGNAWGWGNNGTGELCLGNKQSYDAPVELPFTGVTALAGASGHAVYDAGGKIYSCGSNGDGVLGIGSRKKEGTDVPAQVTGLNGAMVTELVSAYNNAGALLTNGTFYDWGLNAEGQLGTGSPASYSAVPVQVTLPGSSPITYVAEGGSESFNGQTLVMLADGALFAWGDNSYDQIDRGGPAAQGTPRRFQAPAGVTYEALASSGGTCYAISTTGNVYSWGENNYGQVGNGTRTEVTTPTQVAGGAAQISATDRDVVVFGGFWQRPG